MKYVCWGDDKEDLSKLVSEAVNSESEPVTYGLGLPQAPFVKRHVFVTCSKGHQNIFEVEAPPGVPETDPVAAEMDSD